MKKFWSYVSNGEYCVGTTGQTVYVFNATTGNEIAKFKDLKYAYNVYFSPLKDIFAVKSAEGRLAVYCLENMKLIKKFRFSKIDEAQDEGCCFSKDGKRFYNIEGHGFIHSVIAIYNTDTFKNLEIMGFTDKAKKWSAFAYENRDITGIENWKYPLVELWEKYAR